VEPWKNLKPRCISRNTQSTSNLCPKSKLQADARCGKSHKQCFHRDAITEVAQGFGANQGEGRENMKLLTRSKPLIYRSSAFLSSAIIGFCFRPYKGRRTNHGGDSYKDWIESLVLGFLFEKDGSMKAANALSTSLSERLDLYAMSTLATASSSLTR